MKAVMGSQLVMHWLLTHTYTHTARMMLIGRPINAQLSLLDFLIKCIALCSYYHVIYYMHVHFLLVPPTDTCTQPPAL